MRVGGCRHALDLGLQAAHSAGCRTASPNRRPPPSAGRRSAAAGGTHAPGGVVEREPQALHHLVRVVAAVPRHIQAHAHAATAVQEGRATGVSGGGGQRSDARRARGQGAGQAGPARPARPAATTPPPLLAAPRRSRACAAGPQRRARAPEALEAEVKVLAGRALDAQRGAQVLVAVVAVVQALAAGRAQGRRKQPRRGGRWPGAGRGSAAAGRRARACAHLLLPAPAAPPLPPTAVSSRRRLFLRGGRGSRGGQGPERGRAPGVVQCRLPPAAAGHGRPGSVLGGTCRALRRRGRTCFA